MQGPQNNIPQHPPPMQYFYPSQNPQYNSNQDPARENGRNFPEVVQPIQQYRYPVAEQPLRMPRWNNLEFDGKKNANIHEFLFKYETLAFKSGLVNLEAYIFNYLTGEALQFLWNFVQGNNNARWPEIRQALLSWFGNRETQSSIRLQVEKRTQGNRESVREFILEVKRLNSRLHHPFGEIEVINILKENLHSAYKNAIVGKNLATVDQLKHVCEEFEHLWNTGFDMRQMHNTPKRTFYNQQINECRGVENDYEIEEEGEEVEAIQSSPGKETYAVCWNCKDIGHIFKDCSKDLEHVFCFGCGKEDVRKPDCLNCQKQALGNWTRGGQEQRDHPVKNLRFKKRENASSRAHTPV